MIDNLSSRVYNLKKGGGTLKEEKIEKLAQLIYSAMPQLRRDYIAPPHKIDEKLPRHAIFCLLILKKMKKISMSELADRLGVSNQQMTRIVNDLEKRGALLRETDEKNRRQVNVSLLPDGEELAMYYAKQAMDIFREKFSGLNEDELDALSYHLKECFRLIQKTENKNR